MDYTQKMNFFKQLPQFLVKFPKVNIDMNTGGFRPLQSLETLYFLLYFLIMIKVHDM